MEPKEINTTTRWSQHCRAKAKDGRVCNLYAPHDEGHMPQGGLEKDRFEDGE